MMRERGILFTPFGVRFRRRALPGATASAHRHEHFRAKSPKGLSAVRRCGRCPQASGPSRTARGALLAFVTSLIQLYNLRRLGRHCRKRVLNGSPSSP